MDSVRIVPEKEMSKGTGRVKADDPYLLLRKGPVATWRRCAEMARESIEMVLTRMVFERASFEKTDTNIRFLGKPTDPAVGMRHHVLITHKEDSAVTMVEIRRGGHHTIIDLFLRVEDESPFGDFAKLDRKGAETAVRTFLQTLSFGLRKGGRALTPKAEKDLDVLCRAVSTSFRTGEGHAATRVAWPFGTTRIYTPDASIDIGHVVPLRPVLVIEARGIADMDQAHLLVKDHHEGVGGPMDPVEELRLNAMVLQRYGDDAVARLQRCGGA
jgi:hypothetical protein